MNLLQREAEKSCSMMGKRMNHSLQEPLATSASVLREKVCQVPAYRKKVNECFDEMNVFV